MRIYQVDAFTRQVFAGNPAAVLLVEEWPEDTVMQAIAQENNLAETAFAKKRPDNSWELRWFTPTTEVQFCGHATLATAHILATETNFSEPYVFHTHVGELTVSKILGGYLLDLPRLDYQSISALPYQITDMFETTPESIFRNFEDIFVDIGTAEAVRKFKPNFQAIADIPFGGLVITARENKDQDVDFCSRYFVPGEGIPEDPVTGSIHCTLVPYWAERFGKTKLKAFQASKRGGWIDCELNGDRVHLIGDAVTYLSGTIYV